MASDSTVEDTQYVIVPNKTEYHSGHPEDQPSHAANEPGRYVAKLFKDGYRITHKASNRDAVHYIMVKFKEGTQRRYGPAALPTPAPTNQDEHTEPEPADEPIPF